jgi:N-acetylglucosaminyldiphosphoundecaprenol N-acetyl-beta-D-mannosaminyltransferase
MVNSRAKAVAEELTAPIRRTNVLGVGVSAVNIPAAVAEIDRLIRVRQPGYVCVSGAHGVMECQRDEHLREIHNRAALVTPDGMPLVWLSRWRGAKHVSRVYGPDLMLAVCEHSLARGYRHFFFGGADGVPERLAQRLMARFPGLTVAGAYSPPFRPLTESEDRAVVERINAARPDVVWVGLSTPKQERWMAAHRDKLDGPVLIGVGAAFDFHAGVKSQAPRWVQKSGFEWLFRMLSEPRRLGRRYAYIVPMFLLLVALQEVGLRRKRL